MKVGDLPAAHFFFVLIANRPISRQRSIKLPLYSLFYKQILHDYYKY